MVLLFLHSYFKLPKHCCTLLCFRLPRRSWHHPHCGGRGRRHRPYWLSPAAHLEAADDHPRQKRVRQVWEGEDERQMGHGECLELWPALWKMSRISFWYFWQKFGWVMQMWKTGAVWLLCKASRCQGINLWRSFVVLSSRWDLQTCWYHYKVSRSHSLQSHSCRNRLNVLLLSGAQNTKEKYRGLCGLFWECYALWA